MHRCPGHLFSTSHNQCKKCTYTRASTPVRWCYNFFAMKTQPTQNSDSTIFAGFYAYVLRLESEALYSTFLRMMTIAFIT